MVFAHPKDVQARVVGNPGEFNEFAKSLAGTDGLTPGRTYHLTEGE